MTSTCSSRRRRRCPTACAANWNSVPARACARRTTCLTCCSLDPTTPAAAR
ncbi:MAG: hypothetical protein MZW92_58695 [Comamonadaceae bacterium]|nr:hypothetical protein [Comamonadaceae bacterium]